MHTRKLATGYYCSICECIGEGIKECCDCPPPCCECPPPIPDECEIIQCLVCNVLCGLVEIRTVIRRGYGISGNPICDMLYSLLCPCCDAIRLRAEVNSNGSIDRPKKKRQGCCCCCCCRSDE